MTIDVKKKIDQPVKNDLRTYDKIAFDQGDDYTTGCLLDYHIPIPKDIIR